MNMAIFSCVKKCIGCGRMDGSYDVGPGCGMFYRPAAKWSKLGGCEGATHVTRQAAVEVPKKRVGQQKQKKEGK
jgi:hypothetical protein